MTLKAVSHIKEVSKDRFKKRCTEKEREGWTLVRSPRIQHGEFKEFKRHRGAWDFAGEHGDLMYEAVYQKEFDKR